MRAFAINPSTDELELVEWDETCYEDDTHGEQFLDEFEEFEDIPF